MARPERFRINGALAMTRLALFAAAALLAAGCAVSPPAATPGVSPTASPSGSLRPTSPSTPRSTQGFALGTALNQSIPPAGAFDALRPPIAIRDGIVVMPGPMDSIAPAPIVPEILSRPITDAGIRRLIDEASGAGLLDGPTDLTGGSKPGSMTAEIAFMIDGAERVVSGDPGKRIVCVVGPCDPPPGTPAAFAGFWAKLETLPDWLGSELGDPVPYEPDRMAILLREPALDANLPIEYADWPIDGGPMRDFGVEQPGAPPSRCGVVDGDQLAVALAAFGAGNQYTRWRDGTGDEMGVIARPLFPGEDSPCFGG
jgi:hypothetical protein